MKNLTAGDAPVPPPATLARRDVLKWFAGSSVLLNAACGPSAVTDRGTSSRDNPIVLENLNTGSEDLPLSRPATNHELEAYATTVSALSGDRVGICVNVEHEQLVSWELFRIGHYAGVGARKLATGDSRLVRPQPAPEISKDTGLLECNWTVAFEVELQQAWITGYYLFKLTSDAGFDCYVPLIIRESSRVAPLLVQASVTTWQAYNNWGDVSLYINHLPDAVGFSGEQGYQVSFDRPYAPDIDLGEVEHAMVRWLEENGYDAAYVTNIDVDREPELLDARRLFMPVGHDEYWSLTERNAITAARAAGLSLGFFSGNTGYRRIRLDSATRGGDRRVITCYKSTTEDPQGQTENTTADAGSGPNARPENEIVGVLWAGWVGIDAYPFVVEDPAHWIFEGTGVERGDALGNIVGYEWDVSSNNGHSPDGLEVIGRSPALHEYGFCQVAEATVYYPTTNSFVFGAGTIGWARALSVPEYLDARVQRMTHNVLARAGLVAATPSKVRTAQRTSTTTARSSVVAGSGVAGSDDGTSAASFRWPSGVATNADGDVFLSDTGNNAIRRISGGTVTTLLSGHSSSIGHLSSPTGIVVDAQGVIYVSDTGNDRIVALDPDGSARVIAGGLTARLNKPRGLAIDSSGNLYVADSRNRAVRRIDRNGVTTLARTDGTPTAVAVADDGSLYFVDSTLGSIFELASDGMPVAIVNPGALLGFADGPGETARLRPADGLVATADALFFCDTGNNRLRRVELAPGYAVSTLLGDGRTGWLESATRSALCLPRGLARSGAGYIVADAANHRVMYVEEAQLAPDRELPTRVTGGGDSATR